MDNVMYDDVSSVGAGEAVGAIIARGVARIVAVGFAVGFGMTG